MSNAKTTFEMGVREYARTPVFLALLLFLPAYFIVVFTRVMPDEPVAVDVPGEGLVQIPMTNVTPALMAPMATALVGGAAGLFLMQSAREVDGRLAIVGANAWEVAIARAGVLALAAVVASVVSVAVMSLNYIPDSLGWFTVATVVTGLMYGGIGALVGLALNRLAGVYVLMFGPLLDLFLAQSPLTQEAHAIAPYLPGHYPMKLVFDAAFTTGVELSNLWLALAYLLVIWLLAAVGFSRALRVD
jgi:ABC-2 type transport system permease protein